MKSRMLIRELNVFVEIPVMVKLSVIVDSIKTSNKNFYILFFSQKSIVVVLDVCMDHHL